MAKLYRWCAYPKHYCVGDFKYYKTSLPHQLGGCCHSNCHKLSIQVVWINVCVPSFVVVDVVAAAAVCSLFGFYAAL